MSDSDEYDEEQPAIPFGSRSLTKCFLVMTGLTGAGKSSSINTLFGEKAEIAQFTGKSDTQTIIEYEIRWDTNDDDCFTVIDTPGFHDTDGLSKDARIMATLEEYLNNHEELGQAYPSAVLFVVNLADQNIFKENNFFIHFLMAIEKLIENSTLIDAGDNTCNLVLVLTHFMDCAEEVRGYPHDTVTMIQGLIKTYTRIPLAVKFIFAENKGTEFKLMPQNGSFMLPSGDRYPNNLFVAIQEIFNNSRDNVAIRVVEKALKCKSSFKKITLKSQVLVREGHQGSLKYMYSLRKTSGSRTFKPTEISKLIEKYWYQLPKLKQKETQLLLRVTNAIIYTENIRTLSDVPCKASDIIPLIHKLPLNVDIGNVLNRVWMFVPDLSSVCKFHFFNMNTNKFKNKASYNLDESYISTIGFKVPSFMRAFVVTNKFESEISVFKTFTTQTEYYQKRIHEVYGHSKLQLPQRSGSEISIVLGHNVLNSKTTRLSAVKEYRHYVGYLVANSGLIPEPTLRHTVVTKVYFGGCFEVVAKSTDETSTNLDEAQRCVNEILPIIGTTSNYRKHLELFNWNFYVNYYGGDTDILSTSVSKVLSRKGAEIFHTWKASTRFQTTALKSEISLSY